MIKWYSVCGWMLCYSVETMAIKCWWASEKEGLKLSTKSVEKDQGPVCIWAYCRWIFNKQVICLPQTEKTPLKCKLTSSDLSRAQPWYAVVCVVPGKVWVWQLLEDSKALCKTGWCLGGTKEFRKKWQLGFIHSCRRRAPWGNSQMRVHVRSPVCWTKFSCSVIT